MVEHVDFGNPTHQKVMRALTETGHYDETANSFEWQALEASDIAYFFDEGFPGLEDEVYALLENTGLHDTTDPEQAACLRRDAKAIVKSVLG